LPQGRRIDHHRLIKYAATQQVPDTPFEVQRMPDRVVVTGNCPACGGLMTKEFPYGIGGTGTKGLFHGRSGPVVPAKATMYCECGHVHPDKPADAIDDGCGRYWRIDLTTP
jgi:hypothetical protein